MKIKIVIFTHLHEDMWEKRDREANEAKILVADPFVAVAEGERITDNEECHNAQAKVSEVFYQNVGCVLGPDRASLKHDKSSLV